MIPKGVQGRLDEGVHWRKKIEVHKFQEYGLNATAWGLPKSVKFLKWFSIKKVWEPLEYLIGHVAGPRIKKRGCGARLTICPM